MTIRKQARHCAEALGRVISVKCHKQPPPEVRTAAFPKTEAEWWCWDLSLWPFPSRSLPCAPPGGRQPPLHGQREARLRCLLTAPLFIISTLRCWQVRAEGVFTAGGGRLDQAEGGTGQDKRSRRQEAPEGWGGERSALRLGQAQ